jgi:hypothetical protein
VEEEQERSECSNKPLALVARSKGKGGCVRGWGRAVSQGTERVRHDQAQGREAGA